MSWESGEPLQGWRRLIWLGLLVISSVVFSFDFACATPFAAFAPAATCTLPRRGGLSGGRGLAGRPGDRIRIPGIHLTVNFVASGVALGLSALMSTLASRLAIGRLGGSLAFVRYAVALVVAFAVYELVLIVSSLGLGGIVDFTPEIQGPIFAVNAVALVGLVALNRVGIAIGIATASRPSIPNAGPAV